MERAGLAIREQEAKPTAAADRVHANDFCREFRMADLSNWAKSLLPLRESSYTQLRPGHFEIHGTAVKSGPVILFQSTVSVASLSHQVPDPSWLAFVLPLRWQGEYVVDGRTASPQTLFLSTGPNGYAGRGGAREFITIGVERDLFADTLAALQGVDREDVAVVGGALDLDAVEVTRLRQLLLRKIGQVRKNNRLVLAAGESLALSDDVVLALARAYRSANPVPGSSRNGDLPSQTIFKNAQDMMRATQGQRVSLADLCRATGVGATSLNAAFQEVCGEPPLRFLRLYRLMQVRATLLHETPQRSAVKRAALSCGFTEAGRFAGEYKRLFGELPSETLERRQS